MWDELKHWYSRARRVINGRDLLLLTPAGVVQVLTELAKQQLGTAPPVQTSADLDAYDPELVDVLADFFRAMGKYYFRLQIRGVENVPLHGSALLVGNHNGGVLPFDTLFTVLAVYDHQGPKRLVRGLGHDSLFAHPVIRSYAERLGILRARPEHAEQSLRSGHLTLVYPGSDWDACRPFAQRNQVVLANRQGFLRLALRNRAPIVPVVSVGTHEQLIILTRGEWLARLLGTRKLMRTNTLPISLALPWGISTPIVPYLPLPAQTTIQFGTPIRFAEVQPEQADDEEVLGRCYAVVETQMQRMLDELARDRIPLFGKLER